MKVRSLMIGLIIFLSITIICLLGVGGYLILQRSDFLEKDPPQKVLNNYLDMVIKKKRYKKSFEFLSEESRAQIKHKNLIDDPIGLNEYYYSILREFSSGNSSYKIISLDVKKDTAGAKIVANMIDHYKVYRQIMIPILESARAHLISEGLTELLQSDSKNLQDRLKNKLQAKMSDWKDRISSGFQGYYSDSFPRLNVYRKIYLKNTDSGWKIDLTKFLKNRGVLSIKRNSKGEINSIHMLLSINPMLNEFVVEEKYYSLWRQKREYLKQKDSIDQQ